MKIIVSRVPIIIKYEKLFNSLAYIFKNYEALFETDIEI